MAEKIFRIHLKDENLWIIKDKAGQLGLLPSQYIRMVTIQKARQVLKENKEVLN